MRILFCSFMFLLFAFTGCNTGTTTTTTTTTVTTVKAILPLHSKLNDKGTSLLMNILSQYYTLKNALVASKASRADSAALSLVNAADSLQTYLANDTSSMAALKPYLDTVINYGKALNTMDDASCERQRLLFGNISSSVYAILRNEELKNAGIYHEYCPMAFNEKGAYWLSEEAEIKNPYFGKKMLECGEVADSLK